MSKSPPPNYMQQIENSPNDKVEYHDYIRNLFSPEQELIFDENIAVENCKEAANHRKRNGMNGIPLQHEMRSMLGEYISSNGEKKPFLAHTRADRTFDFEKIRLLLNSKYPVQFLEKGNFQISNLGKGLINPFRTWQFRQEKNSNSTIEKLLDPYIIQIFDECLLNENTIPNTVLTNAGDLRSSVEFCPQKVIPFIQPKIIAPIGVHSFQNQAYTFNEKKIVLMCESIEVASKATNYLFSYLKMQLPKFRGNLYMPSIEVLVHPLFSLSEQYQVRKYELISGFQSSKKRLAESSTIPILTDINLAYLTKEMITFEYDAFEFSISYLRKLENPFVLGHSSTIELLSKYVPSIRTFNQRKIDSLVGDLTSNSIMPSYLSKLRDIVNSMPINENEELFLATNSLAVLLGYQRRKLNKNVVTLFELFMRSSCKKMIERYL